MSLCTRQNNESNDWYFPNLMIRKTSDDMTNSNDNGTMIQLSIVVIRNNENGIRTKQFAIYDWNHEPI